MKTKYAPVPDQPFEVPGSWARLIDSRSADKLGQQFRDLVKDRDFRRRVVMIAQQQCWRLLEEFHHSRSPNKKQFKSFRQEQDRIIQQLEQIENAGAKLDPVALEKLKHDLQSVGNQLKPFLPRALPVPDDEILTPKFLWAFGFLGHLSLCFQEDPENAAKPTAEQDFTDETVLLAMLDPMRNSPV